jgi:hypothetical protein
MTSTLETHDRDTARPRNRCQPRIAATAVLLTAAAVAAGSRTAVPAPPEPGATLEVVFSPTQGPGALRYRLAREIREARRSLDIALYTGMTAETARAVAARSSSGCPVRVLVDADALACDPDGNERKSGSCAGRGERGRLPKELVRSSTSGRT